MATDYDTPRKTDDDVNEDSIEELKARRNDSRPTETMIGHPRDHPFGGVAGCRLSNRP
jgi:hypothetical protein